MAFVKKICFSGDQFDKIVMAGGGSTYGGVEMRVMGFDGETWGREYTSKTQV
jgi:hypothetical protein